MTSNILLSARKARKLWFLVFPQNLQASSYTKVTLLHFFKDIFAGRREKSRWPHRLCYYILYDDA